MNDALEAGQVIAGRYRLERLVGQGGFGAVWKATQTDIARPVAIKFLMATDGGYDVGRAARFLREVRVIASLQHPNTPPGGMGSAVESRPERRCAWNPSPRSPRPATANA